MTTSKLEWDEKYSVGVQQIDNQHKKMFDTINRLIELLASKPTQSDVDSIVKALVEYKQFHFKTEEDYFDKFNYEHKEEHKAKHREFNSKLVSLIDLYKEDTIALAFSLVNFLEDWLIDHLMVEDQKYIECFRAHGLK
ncbi:MAG: bacteriohemerythrin [Candidatus Roizmanbacteria bacterium]|nr:bacteriohemerythrin [Candidatus Roizmanbacteria bacterium]